MIKGIISLITAFGVSDKSDIITVLNAVGDAPFYFMPFIIGYAAAKRFKIKEIFSIMIAGILMYSTFLSPAEGITGYQFGPISIPAYNYKGSIFPVILSVWIFSIVFHFIDKHMPKNLRIVFFRRIFIFDYRAALPWICSSFGQLGCHRDDKYIFMAVCKYRTFGWCTVLWNHSFYNHFRHQRMVCN